MERFPNDILSALFPFILMPDEVDEEVDVELDETPASRFRLSTASFMVCENRSASSLD